MIKNRFGAESVLVVLNSGFEVLEPGFEAVEPGFEAVEPVLEFWDQGNQSSRLGKESDAVLVEPVLAPLALAPRLPNSEHQITGRAFSGAALIPPMGW